MLLYPLPTYLVTVLIVTLTAAFTDRGSPVRYLSLLILLGFSFLVPHALSSFSDSRGWAGRVPAGGVFWSIVTVADRLIIRGWDWQTYSGETARWEAKKGIKRDEGEVKAMTRMEFGGEVSGNARGIGTFWEVKNVPQFTASDPNYVPGRMSFLARHIGTVVACYYMHNWAIAKMMSLDHSLLHDSHIPILSRLSKVTMEELQARSWATFGYWAAQAMNMQFFYSMSCVLTAITAPNDIKLYRPLFGSPVDAYSVRNAWGKSWHQCLRSGLEGVSGFFAHDVLRLPSFGLPQRYSKIFFSFAISGVMHVFADAGGQVPMSRSGAFQFFCVQAFGIMFEDAIKAVWRKLTGLGANSMHFVARLVGYVWVAAFLIWSTPVWIYPVILGMREEDAMLGFAGITAIIFGRSQSEFM